MPQNSPKKGGETEGEEEGEEDQMDSPTSLKHVSTQIEMMVRHGLPKVHNKIVHVVNKLSYFWPNPKSTGLRIQLL